MSEILVPSFDPASFSDEFFAEIEQETSDEKVTEQAQTALAGILTVQGEDEKVRTYAQIKQETETFFSNPLIQEVEERFNVLAAQYAHWCVEEEVGSYMNDGSLKDVFSVGDQINHPDHDHGTEYEHRKKHESNGDSGNLGWFGKKKSKPKKAAKKIISWF